MNAISSLKNRLKKEKLDGLFVSKPANVSYLSGFSGGDSFFLVTDKKDFFITDFRYAEQAKAETSGFDIQLFDNAGYFDTSTLLSVNPEQTSGFSPRCVEWVDFVAGLFEKSRLKRVGFEAKHISYGAVGQIRDRLKGAQFEPAYDMVEGLRLIKTPAEIKLIKEAARITLAVYKKAKEVIKPGAAEKDIAAFVEYNLSLSGPGNSAFDAIVLSGRQSAMPHGAPSLKRIGQNDFVLVDSGVSYKGYNSDLTRMFFLGKIPAKIKRIYGIVKAAQERAIKAVRPGVKAASVDEIAREYIQQRGFGKYFGHSLGHGIGREVHERPYLSRRSMDVLAPGEVFTIEPGIYVPGLGGVRIEDMVLVTEKGSEALS